MAWQTTIEIDGEDFLINCRPTYEGHSFRGHRIEGLLLNARMVQATFNDRNPETREMFAYADGPFDADRNTRGCLDMMPVYRAAGLLAMTVNFQGGSPFGYSQEQHWVNSAFEANGALRSDDAGRMAHVIEQADALGMVVILGLFYFGQDNRLHNEAAVQAAVTNATNWVLERGYGNVVIEIANEISVGRYSHPIIKTDRCHELIAQVQEISKGRVANRSGRLYVGASYSGGYIPTENVVACSDIILPHGNHVEDPKRISQMAKQIRRLENYRGQPILFNEDDHYAFDQPRNNFLAAVSEHASWGFFDYRMHGDGAENGFQSVPTDWRINSERKRGFFGLLADMTGSEFTPESD